MVTRAIRSQRPVQVTVAIVKLFQTSDFPPYYHHIAINCESMQTIGTESKSRVVGWKEDGCVPVAIRRGRVARHKADVQLTGRINVDDEIMRFLSLSLLSVDDAGHDSHNISWWS